jgi:5'(3')-deoxyribonucleotidase
LNRVFIDMDGVLADFDGLKKQLFGPTYEDGDKLIEMPGAFLMLNPIPGAIEAVPQIFGLGYDVWIATRPAPAWPTTYADKAAWVHKHLPKLATKLIMTQDKGLLGEKGDILIDDRPEKANCHLFPGHLVHFAHDGESPIRADRWYGAADWEQAILILKWLAEK